MTRDCDPRVIGPLGADLAVLAALEDPSGTGSHRAPSSHDQEVALARLQPSHVWRLPEYDSWEPLLDQLLPGWQARVTLSRNLWGGVGGMAGSGAIVFSLRLLLLRYLDALAVGAPGVYTRLLLTRADHHYACDHPRFDTPAGVVHVFEGPMEHGVSDRHTLLAFGDRQRVLGVLPWLVERHPNMSNANPEVALRAYYAAGRVRIVRMPRVAFVVASGADRTRWASRKMPCNLTAPTATARTYLKYPSEHFLAVRTCGRDPCPFRPNHTSLAKLFDVPQSFGSAAESAGGRGGDVATGKPTYDAQGPAGEQVRDEARLRARNKARDELLGAPHIDHGYIDGVRWR